MRRAVTQTLLAQLRQTAAAGPSTRVSWSPWIIRELHHTPAPPGVKMAGAPPPPPAVPPPAPPFQLLLPADGRFLLHLYCRCTHPAHDREVNRWLQSHLACRLLAASVPAVPHTPRRLGRLGGHCCRPALHAGRGWWCWARGGAAPAWHETSTPPSGTSPLSARATTWCSRRCWVSLGAAVHNPPWVLDGSKPSAAELRPPAPPALQRRRAWARWRRGR